MTQLTTMMPSLLRCSRRYTAKVSVSLLVASIFAASMFLAPERILGQQIAGEYQVEVRGTTYYVDRTPEELQLSDNTTLIVKQQGDQIELTFRGFASAMSTTLFRGYVGNDRFVASWSSVTREGEAKLITGEVDGRRLRGRLILSRTTSKPLVPGWTEVEFAAVPNETSAQRSGGDISSPAVPGFPTGRQQSRRPVIPRPGGVLGRQGTPPSAPATREATAGSLSVDLPVFLLPEKPTARQKIRFAVGVPTSSAVDVSRIDLFVGGQKVGTTTFRYFEVTAGPYPAGRLEYRAVVTDTAGRTKATVGDVMVGLKAPYGGIKGRISGNLRIVDKVSLTSESRGDVAEVQPNSSGYYTISYVPPGRYWLTVNAGKNPTIEPAEQLEVAVRANESTVQHFTVR